MASVEAVVMAQELGVGQTSNWGHVRLQLRDYHELQLVSHHNCIYLSHDNSVRVAVAVAVGVDFASSAPSASCHMVARGNHGHHCVTEKK